MTTTSNEAKQLTIVLERSEGKLWGRVEGPGILYTTSGGTVEEITQNLRDLIADFLEHEGKDHVEWQGVTAERLHFNFKYDLTAFFEVFSEVKISAVAAKAGLNQGLVRQYASGAKHASRQQAKRIEAAIHQIGEELMSVKIF